MSLIQRSPRYPTSILSSPPTPPLRLLPPPPPPPQYASIHLDDLMRCAAAVRSLLPLPLSAPAAAAPIHTSAPPLAAELEAGDALHALLSTLPPSLPSLFSCLSLLSRRLTSHSVADALFCAALPPASRLRLFLFSALTPRLRSPLLHSRAVVPILLATDADAAIYDAIADAQAAGLQPPTAAFEALVFAHASAGRHHEAVEAFSRMEADFGCRPTTFVYNTVLRVLVDSGVVPLALALYNRMVSAGCLPNRATYNVLMDGLCKRGMSVDALKLFDEMLQRGITPNVKTHTVLLSSMCNSRQLKDAENLLHSMKDKGCPPDEVTYNAFLSGLCKASKVDEAIERLEALRSTGAFVLGLKGYSCLINGLFLAGRYEEGFQCYMEMLEADVSPDIVLYTIMIRGCAEAGRTTDAFAFFYEMKEKGFTPDTFCYNTLLKALCDAGDLDRAHSLMSEMAQNNVVLDTSTHTIMIRGLCKKRLVDEALQVFHGMAEVGCHPTVMTYNVLIDGLYRAHRLEEARMLFYKMELGNNPSLFLRLTLGANQVTDSESLQKLVNSMCQSGQVLKAFKLVQGIIDSGVVPDVVTYNTLLNGLCKVRNLDGALRLFKELQVKGFSPDEITYGTLIDSLLRAHRFNDAMMLFQDILHSGGTPSLSIYNSMMRSLCRMKKLSQAVNLWFDHLPQKYNLSTEDEVIASARKKFEEGPLDEAVRELIKIDQEYGSVNSSPYTIWLIGLIQARRIDDALKIFHILEESGIDITPACCARLSKHLCWEGNLDSAVDVMLYTLKKRLIMCRHVGNRLISSLCIHHRRKDAQVLAWRMHLVGYDMDAYLRESTKGLLYSQ